MVVADEIASSYHGLEKPRIAGSVGMTIEDQSRIGAPPTTEHRLTRRLLETALAQALTKPVVLGPGGELADDVDVLGGPGCRGARLRVLPTPSAQPCESSAPAEKAPGDPLHHGVGGRLDGDGRRPGGRRPIGATNNR